MLRTKNTEREFCSQHLCIKMSRRNDGALLICLGALGLSVVSYMSGHSDGYRAGYKKGEDDSGKVQVITRYHDVDIYHDKEVEVFVQRCARCDPPWRPTFSVRFGNPY